MLLRNLDQSERLCNGIRFTITKLVNHVFEAIITYAKNIGNIIYISRMSMSHSQLPWSFKAVRRQFSIIVSFAIIINKFHGQSLDNIDIYFSNNVFSHGQSYVTMSRVKTKKGLKILINNKDKQSMTTLTNVIFKKLFTFDR